MPEKRKQEVFLSYSPEDKAWVSEFAAALREAGVPTWFDVHALLPGERWVEQVRKALRESNTLIVILSRHNAQSPWTFFELGAAVADRKRIIPVLAQEMVPEQVPAFLRNFQYLQETSPSEAGKRVAEALKAVSSKEAPPEDSPDEE
jgi:hypothetical protein